IVTSNRPRSRVTRTRTEADRGPAPDTEGRRLGRLLEPMAVSRYGGRAPAAAIEEKAPLRRRGLRCGLRDRFAERSEHELDVLALRIQGQFLLRDFCAERHDVAVVVLVQDVTLDQGGLAHGMLADEADFHLHSPWFHHDGPRRDSRKSSDDFRYSLGSISSLLRKTHVLRP